MIILIGITLIVLGKLKENYLRCACDEYLKRLTSLCKMNVIELSPARLPDDPTQAEVEKALDAEKNLILSKIPKNSKVVSLCIEGKQMSSKKFSAFFDETAVLGQGSVVFIIGSSYGLSEEIKAKSDLRMSMSEMTFPHQLARVMLLEQIYRALMISSKRKYDK